MRLILLFFLGGGGVRDRFWWGKPRKNTGLDPWDSLPKQDTDTEIGGSREGIWDCNAKEIPEDNR